MLIRIKRKLRKHLKFSPTRMLLFGFLFLISMGTLILMLPVSSRSGQWTPFINSLFTATSATCVTGQIVYDTYTHFSGFGQVVIITLIQIGGLGFMTMATFISFLLKRPISMKERVLQLQALNVNEMNGIIRLTKHILIGTLLFEGAGALILTLRFIPDFGFPKAVQKGVFHAISAFCNAGFDIMGEKEQFVSLTGYVNDITVNIVITSLVIIGGLGFIVWEEIYTKRSIKKLSIYSKLVLTITSCLIIIGAVLIFIFEYSNPDTLGKLSLKGKMLASYFHSVIPRTAGFNTLEIAKFTGSSKALTVLLMFIGGSSGSTAGGIKTSTFGLLVITVIAVARGRREVVYKNRTFSTDIILRAITIVAIGVSMVTVGAFIICVQGDGTFSQALFESTSTFGTVGLTLGITPYLSTVSKLVLIINMFFGRVGILTITYALVKKMNNNKMKIKHPETKLIIG